MAGSMLIWTSGLILEQWRHDLCVTKGYTHKGQADVTDNNVTNECSDIYCYSIKVQATLM